MRVIQSINVKIVSRVVSPRGSNSRLLTATIKLLQENIIIMQVIAGTITHVRRNITFD